jgi:pyruvate dehydrogenase (quinone)
MRVSPRRHRDAHRRRSAGALEATDEVVEVVEILGAGVAKALLGKAAVPDELPYSRDLNLVTGEQRALAGDPKFDASRSLPEFPG